jgi:hypothetical protein
MTVPDYDTAWARAEERAAFSNGFEWDRWSAKWCGRCAEDVDESCSLVMIGFMGRKPAEWVDERKGDLDDRYRCVEFQELPSASP